MDSHAQTSSFSSSPCADSLESPICHNPNSAPRYGTVIPNRIFVCGFDLKTTEQDLYRLFSRHGVVKEVKIVNDRAGIPKGYGVFKYKSSIDELHFRDRKLNIAQAIRKQQVGIQCCSVPSGSSTMYMTTSSGYPYTYHNGMAYFPTLETAPVTHIWPVSLTVFFCLFVCFCVCFIEKNPNLPPHSRVRAWFDTDENEMKKFIGILMLMGIIRKLDIEMYWSTDPMYATPIFAAVMTRNRFSLLLKFFHLNDNRNEPDKKDPNRDRLFKLHPLIDHLFEAFQLPYMTGPSVAVDESLLLWKGRLQFRQYLPLKRARFGIKMFCLAENSGYIYRFRVYTGKEDPMSSISAVLPDECKDFGLSEKRCRVCSKKGQRRDVKTFCSKCPSNPGLCAVPCFGLWHSKLKYWE
uniref:RRM domain-containing protein n=1 Tax=Erpetoichthys calabaricus TaxID=27687 RepID=A0A8C4T5A9_ERPCA